ncbi:hypothetical protein N180_19530 [Pedobacter antarcticus 4BY]|uniref:Uncharacterized protein n=2 Tax=Pedobacter antarcticus TaxID=34086 RepID=A0A081PG32_9SPHI|nr:hypothetical protein [Pedobacter antarcticus]KEQ29655.1 hypothetical protein N180_19530 [Pedobacter antarcticus 4BY]SFF00097.1 hypothetical protein SAMN03003324_02028 [Pedobacter antarcticus]
MFLPILAATFYLFAIIAAFKMDTPLKGFLFILAVAGVSGILYLFVLFPGISGLAVALMLAAFILRQKRK